VYSQICSSFQEWRGKKVLLDKQERGEKKEVRGKRGSGKAENPAIWVKRRMSEG
jgi:hypothetical protein